MTSDYAEFTRMLMDDIRSHGAVTTGPMAGRPLMILTTTGARTGQERTAIVTYTRDADRYVIAASKSGAPTNPAWYYNLQANPEVTVELGGACQASGVVAITCPSLTGSLVPGLTDVRNVPSLSPRR